MTATVIWQKSRLGDFFRIKHGFAFKGESFTDEGNCILLTPGNFNLDGGLKLKGDKEKYYSGDIPEEFVLRKGDLIVAMTDLTQNAPILGSPAIIPEDGLFLHNQRLGKITELNEDKLNRKFLYYLFNTWNVRAQIKASATGATVKHTAPERIYSVEVCLPPHPTQRKIAAILSAYDDLIENNLRRIEILEEIAQNLYFEWFVKFRFPGHEKSGMVDSAIGRIPEGWEVKEMREVADVIDCLHSKKPVAIENGHGILLQLFNIANNGKIDLSKKYLISESDYELWTSRIEVQSGDCVITNVGRIAAVAQIPKGVKAALGRNMTSVRAKLTKITPTFLIEYLLSPHMENEVVKKRDSGTIMDSLNVKGIVKLLVPIPPKELMTRFEVVARPIRRHIEVLVGKNNDLRQTRDLLLPKLLSGELDVSDLDIKTGDY